MSSTGDKIDYTLRIQKNIERKILCDIIRSLNYFATVDQYRYIGFGSFYYKDFLLLHETYNIHEGISVEKDRTSYARNVDFIDRCCKYFKELWNNKKIQYFTSILQNLNKEKILLSKSVVEYISEKISKEIAREYFDNISRNPDVFSGLQMVKTGNYDYAKAEHNKDVITDAIINVVKVDFENWCLEQGNMLSDTSEISFRIDEILTCMSGNKLPFDFNDYSKYIFKIATNRFLYNKPYGFIEIKFDELTNAFDLIEWSEEQRNIIWMDHDSFIDAEQLNGLEKSIRYANRGDLIIFSTSMGTDAKERHESLKKLKCETERVIENINLKECDDKYISRLIGKIVRDTVADALSKKNSKRETDFYKILPVVEFVYSDGTLMYTYGIIMYSDSDDETYKNFPGVVLKDNAWYPNKEDKCYRIYVPALTHKEVNAINQMLPNAEVDVIAEELPFIQKKRIKQYIEIWRYYPHFLEVEYYV